MLHDMEAQALEDYKVFIGFVFFLLLSQQLVKPTNALCDEGERHCREQRLHSQALQQWAPAGYRTVYGQVALRLLIKQGRGYAPAYDNQMHELLPLMVLQGVGTLLLCCDTVAVTRVKKVQNRLENIFWTGRSRQERRGVQWQRRTKRRLSWPGLKSIWQKCRKDRWASQLVTSAQFTFCPQVSGGLRKVEAPQGGTKWHKAAGDSGKLWCEAKNDDGSRLKSVYFLSLKTWSSPQVLLSQQNTRN